VVPAARHVAEEVRDGDRRPHGVELQGHGPERGLEHDGRRVAQAVGVQVAVAVAVAVTVTVAGWIAVAGRIAVAGWIAVAAWITVAGRIAVTVAGLGPDQGLAFALFGRLPTGERAQRAERSQEGRGRNAHPRTISAGYPGGHAPA